MAPALGPPGGPLFLQVTTSPIPAEGRTEAQGSCVTLPQPTHAHPARPLGVRAVTSRPPRRPAGSVPEGVGPALTSRVAYSSGPTRWT